MVLNGGGTLCASASSDGTMRVWDLGQQRCVSSYAVHDGAVWALAMDPAFTAATTGGRDGCVYRWAAAAWVPFGSYQPHPCKIFCDLPKVTEKNVSTSSINHSVLQWHSPAESPDTIFTCHCCP